ncbi:hypothetical protein GGX14DRAFT_406200 [Mycena pura]|uniref:Uncharacterized protein n=1 Tax=Mycena pura TaxID=153505 RepID=A0AAD6Y5R8_9AGAR|nr:hypothetical protein GGX14DRAFT_406200 [Mycena pura]
MKFGSGKATGMSRKHEKKVHNNWSAKAPENSPFPGLGVCHSVSSAAPACSTVTPVISTYYICPTAACSSRRRRAPTPIVARPAPTLMNLPDAHSGACRHTSTVLNALAWVCRRNCEIDSATAFYHHLSLPLAYRRRWERPPTNAVADYNVVSRFLGDVADGDGGHIDAQRYLRRRAPGRRERRVIQSVMAAWSERGHKLLMAALSVHVLAM